MRKNITGELERVLKRKRKSRGIKLHNIDLQEILLKVWVIRYNYLPEDMISRQCFNEVVIKIITQAGIVGGFDIDSQFQVGDESLKERNAIYIIASMAHELGHNAVPFIRNKKYGGISETIAELFRFSFLQIMGKNQEVRGVLRSIGYPMRLYKRSEYAGRKALVKLLPASYYTGSPGDPIFYQVNFIHMLDIAVAELKKNPVLTVRALSAKLKKILPSQDTMYTVTSDMPDVPISASQAALFHWLGDQEEKGLHISPVKM